MLTFDVYITNRLLFLFWHSITLLKKEMWYELKSLKIMKEPITRGKKRLPPTCSLQIQSRCSTPAKIKQKNKQTQLPQSCRVNQALILHQNILASIRVNSMFLFHSYSPALNPHDDLCCTPKLPRRRSCSRHKMNARTDRSVTLCSCAENIL